jgi:hypothetical protein
MKFDQFSLQADDALSGVVSTNDPNLAAYTREYDVLLDWFASNRGTWTRDKVRLAGLSVYGWMPTILRAEKKLIDESAINGFFHDVAQKLNSEPEQFPEQSFNFLNRSVVGTSKFLHFWAPNYFAIWDSRICTVLYGHPVANNVALYREYSSNIRQYAKSKTKTLREVEFALFATQGSDGQT